MTTDAPDAVRAAIGAEAVIASMAAGGDPWWGVESGSRTERALHCVVCRKWVEIGFIGGAFSDIVHAPDCAALAYDAALAAAVPAAGQGAGE